MSKASILFICLISIAFSIKMDIINEDYVEVMVGNPPEKLSLMIDPFSPFTYIFSDRVDKSTTKEDAGVHTFQNVFGTFKGEWKKDFFFPTNDKIFSFKIKYLKVTEKNSLFDADGVLGLGYSEDSKFYDCSIYHQLSLMKDVLTIKKGLSYDKRTKQLTIGEIPYMNAPNRVTFPLVQKKDKFDTIESYVELAKIGFKDTEKNSKSYVDVNQDAMLTLMPVIIAPEKSEDLLRKTLMPKYALSQDIKTDENPEKFFTDFYYDTSNEKIKTEFVFTNIAYGFKHSYEVQKDPKKYQSAIKLGNRKENKLDFWYIGIDLLGAKRADFDFEENTVILYGDKAYDITKNKYLYIIGLILFSFAICIVFYLIFVWLCTKTRQKEIKKGEELMEL